MWGYFFEGWVIGAVVALAVGPVAVLLMRIGVLRGWMHFSVSALGTGLSFGVSMAIALSCVEYVQFLVEHWPVAVHLSLAVMVLGVAWKVFLSNKKITLDDIVKKGKKVNIFHPPVLSLFCPFTSILILNIFATRDMMRMDLTLGMKALVVCGSILGQFCVFMSYNVGLHIVSRTISQRVVLWFTKTAPFIVAYYGFKGVYNAFSLIS